jgi:hypothetical protein
MTKVIALNFYKKLIPANKNNFDLKFTDFDIFLDYLSSVNHNDCLVFYGESNNNILYKKNGILHSIVKNFKFDVSISCIESNFNGNFDLFTFLPLEYNNFNGKISTKIINETYLNSLLLELFSNRLTSSLNNFLKSHIIIKIYNENKTIYLIDLSISQLKKPYENNYFTFVNNSIRMLKENIINKTEFNSKESHFIEILKNINSNLIFIGVIEDDRILNNTIFNFVKDYKKLIPFQINKDNKPFISYNDIPIKEKKKVTFSLQNLLSENENITNGSLTTISSTNIELNKQLQKLNRSVFKEAIKNYSLMTSYSNDTIDNINEKVQKNLLTICTIILKNLKKIDKNNLIL